MSRLKRALALILSAVAVAALSSCDLADGVASSSFASKSSSRPDDVVEHAIRHSGNIRLYTDKKEFEDYDSGFINYFEKYYNGNIEYTYTTDFTASFLTDYASNKAPDAVELNSVSWPTVGNRGLVYSTDDLKNIGVLGLERSELAVSQKLCKANFSIGERCYGVSVTDCDPLLAVVNIDLFSRRSVASPMKYYSDNSWDFDTFLTACREVSDPSGGVSGFYTDEIDGFLVANGCEPVRWSDTGMLITDMLSDNFISTLGAVRELYSSRFATEDVSAFANGECGISAIRLSELLNQAPTWSFYWEVLPFPRSDANADGYLPGTVKGIGITSNAANPQGALNYAIARSTYDDKYYDSSDSSNRRPESKLLDEQQQYVVKSAQGLTKQNLYVGVGTLNIERYTFLKDIRSSGKSVADVVKKYEPIIDAQCKSEMTMRQQ